jgi:membrane peptidoglycan carboxypeptidase
VIAPRTARELTAMLEDVVKRGTGKRARLQGYRLAGKSGTAQKVVGGAYSDSDFVSSFGGYGPLPDPRIVCLVVIDTPRGAEHHGGVVAGPVFRRIMGALFARLRVPRDGDGLVLPERRQRRADYLASRRSPPPPGTSPASATGRVPDLRGLSLREAVARLSAGGYRAEVRGSGFVLRQHPAAGHPLEAGKSCRLLLASTEARR